MRVLTADQGNTKIKFSLFDDQRLVERADVITSAREEILSVIDSWSPDGGIFSSVGHFDIRFVETLRQLVKDRLLVLTPHTPLPIRVEYETRETLGVDRLATAVGACTLFKGAGGVVADCGSAVTLDLLQPGCIFAGGRISPGVMMRLKSLHEFTARLPLVSPAGDTPVCGYSTETALRSGVVRGVAGEVVATSLDYLKIENKITSNRTERVDEHRTEVCRIVLTGGDAELLEPFVRECLEFYDRPYELETHPDLLSKGLLEIYDYNLEAEGNSLNSLTRNDL